MCHINNQFTSVIANPFIFIEFSDMSGIPLCTFRPLYFSDIKNERVVFYFIVVALVAHEAALRGFKFLLNLYDKYGVLNGDRIIYIERYFYLFLFVALFGACCIRLTSNMYQYPI